MSQRQIAPGQMYRHYKKNTLYEIVGTATHTETEEELIVYRDLQSNRLFARPSEIFFENVLFGGSIVQRFKLEDNYGDS
jgi:hypothetical protein